MISRTDTPLTLPDDAPRKKKAEAPKTGMIDLNDYFDFIESMPRPTDEELRRVHIYTKQFSL